MRRLRAVLMGIYLCAMIGLGWGPAVYNTLAVDPPKSVGSRLQNNADVSQITDSALETFFTDYRPYMVIGLIVYGIVGGLVFGGRARAGVIGSAAIGILGLIILPSVIRQILSFVSS